MEITLEHTYRCHATTEMNIQTVYKYLVRGLQHEYRDGLFTLA